MIVVLFAGKLVDLQQYEYESCLLLVFTSFPCHGHTQPLALQIQANDDNLLLKSINSCFSFSFSFSAKTLVVAHTDIDYKARYAQL